MDSTSGKWKRILVLALVALVGLSACGQTATPQTSFGNVPVGTGTSPEPGTNGKPQPAPNGHSESIIATRNIAYVGSDNGNVYALAASDGSIHWQRHVGGVAFVFGVVDGVLYATTAANGDVDPATTPGAVYALDADTGGVLWQFRPGASDFSLMVRNGVVYAGTGAEGNKMTIFALQASTGALLWHYSSTTALPGLLGVVNGVVYASQVPGFPSSPSTTSTLSALDAGTGKVVWQVPIEGSDGVAAGAPVESNGILYLATTNGALYAFNSATGNLLWHAAQPNGQLPPDSSIAPVLANGFVYIGDEQGISAYRASDGTLQWQFKSAGSGPFEQVLPQPVVIAGVVYFGADGLVAALGATNGTLLWQRKMDGPMFGPMLVTDGLVINNGGPVYALRASDGMQLWQATTLPSGMWASAPAGAPEAVGANVVYIGSDDGVVHTISATNGGLLWHYAIPELAVPTPPVYLAYVTFSQRTSYQQALEIVTNLGLKSILLCTSEWINSDTDTKSTFSQGRELVVLAMVSSAPLWMGRLLATPGVMSAQSVNGPISCPGRSSGNGPPDLEGQQEGTYVQVAFASTASYATALEGVDGLGFRLASPCYEQARARGFKPTWQPMSQAESYAKTEQLVLATTNWNATTWLDQLRGLAGVSQITTPYTATC